MLFHIQLWIFSDDNRASLFFKNRDAFIVDKRNPNSYASGGLTGITYESNGTDYFAPSALKSYLDSNVHSNHVVLLLGSCSSGAFVHTKVASNGESEIQEDFDPNSFVNAFIRPFQIDSNAGEFGSVAKYSVIAAAEIGQSSYSNAYYGYMARYLCKAGGYDYFTGERGKNGDTNKDKKISLQEAYKYVRRNVTNSTVVKSVFSDPNLILFQ